MERGRLEESLQLVPTPQALLSEGIAEVGAELLIDDEVSAELARICATPAFGSTRRRRGACARRASRLPE